MLAEARKPSTALVRIDGCDINDASDCYVIAEVGSNHQGSVELCQELFIAAKEAGANAVKIQKRKNSTLFTSDLYDQPYENQNSYGLTYGSHREALEFDDVQYRYLKQCAREIGITFFATAFDIASADYLAELEMPAFKLASGDLTNTPLLRHVAQFGKPTLISTGGATMDDVQRAVDVFGEYNDQFAILQCTAGYPPAWDELNLRVIETYRSVYPDRVVGLSSHDSGIAMALVGYVLGARIVEKHFTLNRAMKGADHAFSLEPEDMRKMVRDLRRARLALGDGIKRSYDVEMAPLHKMSKKLVAARTLPAGTIVGPDDIAAKSPGNGLAPYHIDALVGRMLKRDLASDELLSLDDVEDVWTARSAKVSRA